MTLALALSLPSPQPHLLHPEKERAGRRSVGTDAQDGLAGKGKEAENRRSSSHPGEDGGGPGAAFIRSYPGI